ncbi:MAG TPA: CHRD domain-containing protein [Acidimicrobiia bacterium]|jgi:hypothetical protein
MRRPAILAIVLALVGALGGPAAADSHFAAGGAFDARLTGDEEVPAVTTNGSGYVAVEISEDGDSIDYRLYVSGLDDVIMAHIHVGAPGENGPPVVFLFGPVDPGVASDGLLAEGTITEADLLPMTGVDTMAQLVESIRTGGAYVNVHTTTNPGGEMRGQLAPAAFNLSASLSGANEVPAVATDGTGIAALSIAPSQDAINYTLITYGLVDTIMAHIHIGPAGVNGPVAVFLFGPEPAGVNVDGILAQGTITEADLLPTANVFDGEMDTLIDHLRAGTAYVNVHTIANPGGEIRGQTEGLARAEAGSVFTDDDGSVHEADIEVIAAAGITRGCNPPANDQYCPTDVFTRGQAAAFFNRALNLRASSEDAFTDDDGTTFEGDIDAIAAVGLTVGCNPPTNDNYCPEDSVTRAQWASFMVRALGLTEGGSDDAFVDDENSVHEQDINRLAAAGITAGCNPPTNDRFCPDDPVTRQQAASFLLRALGWRALDS